MGFTIEELISEILKANLDDEQKTVLLSKLFKKGQLEDEVFLLKNDGEDLFNVWRRQINPDNGRTEVIKAYDTAEEAVTRYTLSVMKEQTK